MTKYNSSLVVEVSGSLKIPNWWEKTLFTCFIYLFYLPVFCVFFFNAEIVTVPARLKELEVGAHALQHFNG